MLEKYELSKQVIAKHDQFVDKPWEEIKTWKGEPGKERVTGVDLQIIRDLGDQITKLPSDLKPHRQIAKIYELRNQSLKNGEGIDWATAEQLAWATLIKEGY